MCSIMINGRLWDNNELLKDVDNIVYDKFCREFNEELGKVRGNICDALYVMKRNVIFGEFDVGKPTYIAYLLGIEHAFRYINRVKLKKKSGS